MNDTSAHPIFVFLLFILRCLVPLAVLFGISYLLRKMGLVAADAPEPLDDRNENGGEKTEAASREQIENERTKNPGADSNSNNTVETKEP